MGAAENRNKNQAMAAHLIRIGYPHGRRFSVGVSGYPENAPGSAAYRRLVKGTARASSPSGVPWRAPKTRPDSGDIAEQLERPAGQCIGCGSHKTSRSGRSLTCLSCETTYAIPAAQLAREVRPRRAAAA